MLLADLPRPPSVAKHLKFGKSLLSRPKYSVFYDSHFVLQVKIRRRLVILQIHHAPGKTDCCMDRDELIKRHCKTSTF